MMSLLMRNSPLCKRVLVKHRSTYFQKLFNESILRGFATSELTSSSDNANERKKIEFVEKYSPKEIAISGAGGFVGLSILSSLNYGLALGDITTILASFGPTSMMIFVFPEADFAQPKNVIGGHIISAFWGICTSQLVNLYLEAPWLAGPTAVSGAIILMLCTRLVHPPAAGTSLLAALGSQQLQAMGFQLLIPTSIGATILVMVGVLFNNLFKGRSYPKYWL